MNRLEDFIMPTQLELFSKLRRIFKRDAIYSNDSYILVKGKAPIMLLAHLDTVHKERVKSICRTENGNILMSPEGIGGDDRCGVYALVMAHRQAAKKPWLLFTCDEEIGGIGATKFCEHHKKGKLPKELASLKMLVEIDRKGEKDAVYYDCANDDFEAYITSKGFKTEWGSFSDISYVAPRLGVAAVNLSSGYYNAHTQHEYINRTQLNAVVTKLGEIITDTTQDKTPKYDYVEDKFGRWETEEWWSYYAIGTRTSKNHTRHNDFADVDDAGCLDEIPSDIADEYTALLDYYTARELNFYRKEYGDGIILQLFKDEIGQFEVNEETDDTGVGTGGGNISDGIE